MESNNDVVDSQFWAENIGCVDNYFDNSFTTLQTSILTVKEYFTQDNNCLLPSKSTEKTINDPNSSIYYHRTINNSQLFLEPKNNNKKLNDWGLPMEIIKKYELKGITEMFDWQVNCLSNPKVLFDSCNLVYSAPTSAGKTLVAEIITVKTILEHQKKVIIILPFVSIVREKMFYLQDILTSSGIRVEGFMGSQSPSGGLKAVHVAICTIEKANSLINRLLDEGNISELGAVIVDELHLLGDPHRGYILELLLTKIKYMTQKFDDIHIQIIGMSATLPNLDMLANWLDAELFITQFRPIPLNEYCLVGNKYYDKNGEYMKSIEENPIINDCDRVLRICLETITEGCSVLIFCMTKNRCESLAQSISNAFYKIGCSGDDMAYVLRNQLNTEHIYEVLEQLKNCPVGLDEILKSTISFGVAYHHAGLTFDERDIIEGGFKSGALRVLIATSTLSSGVNLPAQKVIIRTPVFQRQPINILTYKQMIGRAGRMGKDIKGESIIICSEVEKKIGFDLMMGTLSPVKSCIDSEDKFMRAILEMIASQMVCTKADLDMYSKCTLLLSDENGTEKQNIILEKTLEDLKNYELVRIQNDGDEIQYVATLLGKACLSSSMAPNDGLSLFCELQKARQCLVLETDLHLIYLVTPYSVSSQWGQLDWLHFLTLWESLTKAMKRVGELVGVQERFIIQSLRGGNKSNKIQNQLNIHKRFYTALALQDLVNEVPLSEVASKFQCARGFLQGLQQGAATFAGMVTAFCHQLGWRNMEMLISQFQDRLHFGIHSDLLELMKLPTLNGVRARTLFDSGFDTISSIASGDVHRIEDALHKVVPFQSEKGTTDDDEEDRRKRNKIKNIWITGGRAMTSKEAAENLIIEARKYLQYEIGISDIEWEKKSISANVSVRDNKVGIRMKNTQNELKSQAPLEYVIDDQEADEEKCVQAIVYDQTSSSHIIENKYIEEIFHKDCIPTNQLDVSKGSLNCVPSNQTETIKEISICVPPNQLDVFKDIPNKSKAHIQNKDEILWDSLNFTDLPLENITKYWKNELTYSPDISFGESENKEILNQSSKTFKNASKISKDISIFSSEGENSSLFEDSLPLDLISSKLGNNTEISVTAKNISTNSSSILREWKTTLELNDDENIRLYYDDEDNNNRDNDMNVACDSINISNQTLTIDQFSFGSLKRHSNTNSSENGIFPNKKTKRESSDFLSNFMLDKHLSPILKNSDSKKYIIEIEGKKLDCFILRQSDILNNITILDNISDAGIYLDVKKRLMPSNDIIGSKVFGLAKGEHSSIATINNEAYILKSISVVNNANVCVLLDLTSLDLKDSVMVKSKLNYLFGRNDLRWKYLSLQSTYIHLKHFCCIDSPLPGIDISLIEWLIDTDEKARNLLFLVQKYCKMDVSKLAISIDGRNKQFCKLASDEDLCIRTWFVSKVAAKICTTLIKQYPNAQSIIDIELQVLKILSDCEYYGVTVDKQLASQLLADVRSSQETLQKKAFKICGYHFNFNSSKDVAKVIGIYKGRKVSTKKSVLQTHNTLISSVIIYWRKLNSILTKTLYPLTEKACIYSEGDRINPSYTIYTCTGRVSMHEPNLQNVPRTFSVPLTYLSLDAEPASDDVVVFNCRNIFKASPGCVLVSADYCQLEMRILTHYSNDPVLTPIMCSDVDVFKSIAASWSNVLEEEVDDDLRQRAKQLCYGILYGMGNKTLAQQLDVTEAEAAVFMDSFYKCYPSVKAFTQSIIDQCREKGYVETLMKRRRYLPDINSTVSSKRCAAERQAVNTTIQGSAADIAKAAMCAVDDRTVNNSQKPHLFLQMHDELIYEVPISYKQSFICILKEVMEQTIQLNVSLPVKVKAGYKWGALEEVKT
ncbi:hypothetical protein ACJJTC_003434 [Scirpophaga incertulas]